MNEWNRVLRYKNKYFFLILIFSNNLFFLFDIILESTENERHLKGSTNQGAEGEAGGADIY